MNERASKAVIPYDDDLTALLEQHRPEEVALMVQGELQPPSSALGAALQRFTWRIQKEAWLVQADAVNARALLEDALRAYGYAHVRTRNLPQELREYESKLHHDRINTRQIEASERRIALEDAKRREALATKRSEAAQESLERAREVRAEIRLIRKQLAEEKSNEARMKLQIKVRRLQLDLNELDAHIKLDEQPINQVAPQAASTQRDDAPDFLSLLAHFLQTNGRRPADEHHIFSEVHAKLILLQHLAPRRPQTAVDWMTFADELHETGEHAWLTTTRLNAYLTVMNEISGANYGV